MLYLVCSLLGLTITKEIEMKKLRNIHPGEILQEEFLMPLGLSAYKLSKDIGIPQARVSEIIKGNRRITADTALRLSKYFGNSAKFWLGLQDDYDIEEEEQLKAKELNLIEHYQSNAA
jgi:addiction module HigA family antidote